ncbi:MAG TPA: 3-hydroxyacyl-ACP dehydratase FabZ [Candidatus Binatia bacterium]|nr:3-hydroxyacyl-ACP dehydratase FabZ [Candidatus Binatia bacterium]
MRLDYPDIIQRLPHRYPFLLVDRVIAFADGERLVAIKNVTANEPFFDGHFPGRPIMPGVLICEALVQAGGLLASCSRDGLPAGKGVVLAGLEHARFRRRVIPGDQLRLEVELVHKRRPLWKMKGRALVDGNVAAEAEFLTMEVDSSEMGF